MSAGQVGDWGLGSSASSHRAPFAAWVQLALLWQPGWGGVGWAGLAGPGLQGASFGCVQHLTSSLGLR